MVATGLILYLGKDFLVQHAHFLIEVQFSAEGCCSIASKTATIPVASIRAAFCEGGFLLCQAFNQLALVFRQLAGSHPLKNKWREPCHARM